MDPNQPQQLILQPNPQIKQTIYPQQSNQVKHNKLYLFDPNFITCVCF
jgi:hypothetical protein